MANPKPTVVTLPGGGQGVPLHPFLGIDLRNDPKYVKAGLLLSAQNFLPYQQGTLSKRYGSTMRNATAWAGVLRVPFAMRFYEFLTTSRTPSHTSSATHTQSATPSNTVSATASNTVSMTPSSTPSHTQSSTPSNTVSATPTWAPSNTPSRTPSNTPSATHTPSPSNTPSNTLSPSSTPSRTVSATPSNTPSSTVSSTPSNTVSATPSLMAGGPVTLAYVNKASGDQIGQVEESTGAFIPLGGLPALSANKRCRGTVFGEMVAAYFGNDADGILVTRDGETIDQLVGTQIPTACYVGGPFFDRLLAWHGKRLFYTRTNVDNDFSDPTTGNQQYILVNHSEDISVAFTPGPDRTEVGFMGKLYVCTPTSTWAKLGDFGTGTFTKIHETAGISAPNTLAWTDRGAVGLGIDDVWIFPLDGLPVAIGGAIKPILEDIPKAYRERCAGVFRRGFYYLSLVRPGQTNPDVEYVCDLRNFNANKSDQGIYWIGPIVRGTSGKGIACYVYQSQTPDEQELLGFGASEGRVTLLEDEGTYLDYGEAMTSILESPDLDGGTPTVKGFPGCLVGAYTSGADQVTIECLVNEAISGGEVTARFGEATGYFDESYFDESYFASTEYALVTKLFLQRPTGSKGRLRVTHTSNQELSIKELYLRVEPFGRD